jgi:hypothetical protein
VASTRPGPGARVGAEVLFLGLLSLSVRLLEAQVPSVLFPEPLHLTVEFHDTLTGRTSEVEKYCFGDRIVTVAGKRTTIVDYHAETVTSIDLSTGSHSITNFADFARVRAGGTNPPSSASKEQWEVQQLGRGRAGRYEGQSSEATLGREEPTQRIAVVTTPEVKVSRRAVEALMGLGYPNPPGSLSAGWSAILSSRRPRLEAESDAGEEQFSELPVEQLVTMNVAGESVQARSRVLRIGREPPPTDRLIIPVDSKLIEARELAIQRIGRELDEGAHVP